MTMGHNNNGTFRFFLLLVAFFAKNALSLCNPINNFKNKYNDNNACVSHQFPTPAVMTSNNDNDNKLSFPRRDFLATAASIVVGGGGIVVAPSSASAGEIGAKITQAVTQSDLGISVRRSVVRGAQLFDQADGQWEQFSDRFSLGSERSKQEGRPKPKVIPDPLPLDISTAQKLLDIANQAFLDATGVSPSVVSERVNKIATLVKPSFLRAGMDPIDSLKFENAKQFNFVTYAYFKAYSDILLDQNISFKPFRTKFETQVGNAVIQELIPNYSKTPTISDSKPLEESQKAYLTFVLDAIDALCEALRAKGLVAFTERSIIENEKLLDWIDDLSDLQFTVALDADVTLQAQILLQEQGRRLYPNFARFSIATLLQNIPRQKLSIDDYYFDTDYNSDPNKFEVKEVLVNIILENMD